MGALAWNLPAIFRLELFFRVTRYSKEGRISNKEARTASSIHVVS